MKAAPFDYERAQHLEHALELLSQHGSDAKLIAGGQSLVPMMAMRLVRPALLVDIYRLPELREINLSPQRLRLGAAVRQNELHTHQQAMQVQPLLAELLPWVGHQQTRHRGTVGGSLAHADVSAELPLAFLVMGGIAHVQKHGQAVREIPAESFFLGPMTTCLAEDDILVATDWPIDTRPHSASAFEETSIRHGDYAMASAACHLRLDDRGHLAELRLGVGGVGNTPHLFTQLPAQWIGHKPDPAQIAHWAHAASEELDPQSDIHVQAPFRRHLAKVLIQRVIQRAAQRAQSTTTAS